MAGPLFVIKKRTAVIALEGDYEGAEVTINTSIPAGVLATLGDGVNEGSALQRIEAVSGLLLELVVDWNIADVDNPKHKHPLTAESLLRIPLDLQRQIITKATERIFQTPLETSA